MNARRLLLVHAHPDDESINNGATMAKYVDEGAQVTLVTCTLGEEGEVLVPDLIHLAADNEDALGPHRLDELTDAMAELGVTDFVRLGGDHRFRDSGMDYDENRNAIARTTLRDGIFWTADLLEAANELVTVIRDRKPQVLVTQDERGGYGHPDHVQAHRVAMYASALAGVAYYRPDLGEAWSIDRVLWVTMNADRLRAAVRKLRAAGDTETFSWVDPEADFTDVPMVDPVESLVAEIDGTNYVKQKMAALKAHKTQITDPGPFFSGTEVLGDEMWSHEAYRLAIGKPFPADVGLADDLFAGL